MEREATTEAVAEAPLCWTPPEHPVRCFHDDPRFVLQHDPLFGHPYFGTVNLVRIRNEPVDALRTARQWFRALGRSDYSWWIRESENPPGLVDELVGLGLEVSPIDLGGVALMELDDEPPEVPGVSVRQIESVQDDFRAAEIFAEVFHMDEVGREALGKRISRRWEEGPNAFSRGFFALLDNQPVARGNLVIANEVGALFSGATLPIARGMGCYRALVRARWEAAQALGAGSLVVQAGQNSRPILARIGFRQIDRLTVLIDHC
jgi:hypothetical protein